MKLTIWAPEFKDLPTVKLTLPQKFGAKNVQILYGYTQPSKPYDRTLFMQLILPIHTTKRTLKSMTSELQRIVKKSWDKSNYEIVKVDMDFKSYQSFSYFQLKRTHRALVSPGLLSSPLKVPPAKEPPKKKGTRKKAAKKKSTRKKSSKTKAAKKTRRKSSSKKRTVRRARPSTRKKAARKKATKRKASRSSASKKRSAKKKSSKKRRR